MRRSRPDTTLLISMYKMILNRAENIPWSPGQTWPSDRPVESRSSDRETGGGH